MADEETEIAVNTEGQDGSDGAAQKKRMSGKKIILFIVLPLVLIGGIVGGLLFTGVIGGHKEEEQPKVVEQTPSLFLKLPELLVNLNTKNRRQNYLKVVVTLEIGNPEDLKKLEEMQPKIIDAFQVYLREVRPEDMKGSTGIYRLREELLRRVSVIVQPVEVRDVLFQDVVMQ
ncbi:MAG: flagellar basal body-associated FliL family protein [Alphaproteobacteria bacterium]|jgi:flagellar FliL protein|nr:flagellar basal body-associated FliL family protein [Alphaproteobacteria bacterium]MBP9878407.1 flagellar basal body-associated FliL family protein [Alphaproteobacteria bacterium]